ncbi:MAG: S1 RNA-binding domain-containing protein [Candidatus Spechtbacterales bacterium]|nr:S1 RNA-binding domain-containing protein [Candidatus Spechtbacterales bacterium]
MSMSATATTNNSMKEMVQENKSLFQLPRQGDIVEGTVIGKESGVLYVDLGPIGTGVVYGIEYFKVQHELKNIKPGDKITGKLVEVENEDGYRELSLKKAAEEKTWQKLEKKYDKSETFKVKITDANKGGLMAKTDNMSGFIPVSQLAPQHYPRVEGGDKNKILEELKEFVGETLEVNILDMDSEEGKLIFSERAAESGEIKKALKKYSVGDVVEGEITGIVDFGAFIKFDQMLEGLIHISEMDWSLIESPEDIVSLGDKIKAKIVDIADDGKVSLSIKQLKENPWEGVSEKYKQGDKVKGEVNKIASYGALVKIEDGIQGLVHISELEGHTMEDIQKKLEEGKKYEFEIISVDPEDYKIALKLVE